MNQPFFSFKYSRFVPFFTTVGAFATVLPLPTWLGAACALAYLGGNGWLLGRRAFPKEALGWRTLLGALGVWAGVVLVATAAYYARGLGPVMTFLAVAVTPLLLFMIPGRTALPSLAFAHDDTDRTSARSPLRPFRLFGSLVLAGICVALAVYACGLAASGATAESIRSPWEVVPPSFFAVTGLIALLSFTAAYARLTVAGLTGLVALAYVGVSVAASAYSIGFGFDPFIHRATEAVILASGSIDPKPFYYVGQYATVTIAARMLGIGVDGIDLRLMAVMFALLVPIAYWAMRRGFSWRSETAAPAAFLVMLLPLSSFAATTPQGLANALLMMTAFTAIAFAAGTAPWWFPVLLALTTACIHPLAGIPTIAFVAILIAVTTKRPSKRHVAAMRLLMIGALVVATCVVLPAMFVANGTISGSAGVAIDGAAFGNASTILEAFKGDGEGTRKFSVLLDFTYAWKAVRAFAFAAAGIVGLWLMRERHAAAARAIGLGAFAFFMNYLVLSVAVNFPFLIDYERSNYADRMAELTLFLLIPAAAYAFGRALDRVRKVGFPTLGVGIAMMIAALSVSSVYLAYPRDDRFETGRGWSTSERDIAAAVAIDTDAGGEPYVVLANQAVSAAAIRQSGFTRYYRSHDAHAPGPVFYYPVPTGGPLYALFLKANETLGDRATIIAAMDLAGVDRAYYVVNHYWWDAQRIVGNAKHQADDWSQIDQRTWIFEYVR